MPDTLDNGQIIVTFAEKMPEFPSGSEGLELFVKQNIKIPESLNENGRVVIEFIVEKTGVLTNMRIMKSLSPDCDKEVIRLFESMPRWIPGMNNERKIRIKLVCSIYFNEGKVSTYPNKKKGSR